MHRAFSTLLAVGLSTPNSQLSTTPENALATAGLVCYVLAVRDMQPVGFGGPEVAPLLLES